MIILGANKDTCEQAMAKQFLWLLPNCSVCYVAREGEKDKKEQEKEQEKEQG